MVEQKPSCRAAWSCKIHQWLALPTSGIVAAKKVNQMLGVSHLSTYWQVLWQLSRNTVQLTNLCDNICATWKEGNPYGQQELYGARVGDHVEHASLVRRIGEADGAHWFTRSSSFCSALDGVADGDGNSRWGAGR